MSIVERTVDQSTADDTAAIASLRRMFAVQQAAFVQERYPSLDVRRERLGALAGMVVGHRRQIEDALKEDFGGSHPALLTDLIEILSVAGRAVYTIEQLERWMAPEPRDVNPQLHGSAHAYVSTQPKGVIGNMAPWNFPFDIGLGPLCEMLGAGNRVIVKPSDLAPASASLIRDMVRETFDPDVVDVAIGGIDLSTEFMSLPWDHLMYTGSPQVGRLVARAAAANLVPVTLELGGKCPAVIAADAVTAQTVEEVIGVKTAKNGQMCVTVDYCLVPRDQVEVFVDLAVKRVADTMPAYSRTDDCTGIISSRHFDRLEGMLGEARAAGARTVQLDAEGMSDPVSRRMPLTIIVDPPAGTSVMTEEIFGPLLPIVPYDTIDDAIDHVNAGSRPLGLYAFTSDDELAGRIERETTSGGFARNTAAVQAGLPNVGFGGAGGSGIGLHHGIEGYREFSNLRGSFVRGDGDLLLSLHAPFGDLSAAVVAGGFGE